MRILAVVIFILGSLPSRAEAYALDPDEIEFLHLINEYRAQNGLGCLTPSPTMNAAATWMSLAMGKLDFFDHNEPPCRPSSKPDEEIECLGRDPFQRIRDFGHDQYGSSAENIAAGQRTPFAVFEAWRNSPGHNANMLRPELTAIGIGREIVEEHRYFIFWTNNFSDWIDGDYDCEGNWLGTGPEPGSDGIPEDWEWVGPGGSGGSPGEGGAGGDGGAGGAGGSEPVAPKEPRPPVEPGEFWSSIDPDGNPSGGCATAPGSLGWAGALALLLLFRRRA